MTTADRVRARVGPMGNRGHLLLTAGIADKLPPLYANDEKEAKDVPIIVKFFSPYSGAVWYVTEGSEEDVCDENGVPTGKKDWRFFGFAELLAGCGELGYVMFSELNDAYRGSLPLVERDCHFGKHTLQEAMDKHKEGGRL